VFDGVAGAMTRSVAARPYARPSVFFPSARTNRYAIRVPRPVLITARAIRKASTISQPRRASAPQRVGVTVVIGWLVGEDPQPVGIVWVGRNTDEANTSGKTGRNTADWAASGLRT
jgi:hypothetical protein